MRLRHPLRASMITFAGLFGLDFGELVGGGALLTEGVFGLPGVGLLTYQSLNSLDLPELPDEPGAKDEPGTQDKPGGRPGRG